MQNWLFCMVWTLEQCVHILEQFVQHFKFHCLFLQSLNCPQEITIWTVNHIKSFLFFLFYFCQSSLKSTQHFDLTSTIYVYVCVYMCICVSIYSYRRKMFLPFIKSFKFIITDGSVCVWCCPCLKNSDDNDFIILQATSTDISKNN